MTMKISTAENFIRSATAPMISAGVIAANVSWKITKVSSGMTTPLEKPSSTELVEMPDRNILESPPMNGVNAVASSAVAAPVNASE